MASDSTILFIKNKQIDKQLWDECIDSSPNAIMYAKSFYLDNICSGWHGLTGKNYEWVLPITYRRKYGISYLYQPNFTQQTGAFAKEGIIVPYDEIINWLQRHYKFWDLNWNSAPTVDLPNGALQINPATNFILNLSAGYDGIKANYHSSLLKNLKRSKGFRLIYKVIKDYNKSIDFYRTYYGKRMPHVKQSDYENFTKICDYLSTTNSIICREVVDGDDVTMAIALLLKDGKRLYNMMDTTTEAGRKMSANHVLIDAIIREFSGKLFLFDFEGSDLPGVKNFYQSFGALNEPYYTLRYNALPWPLKLFK